MDIMKHENSDPFKATVLKLINNKERNEAGSGVCSLPADVMTPLPPPVQSHHFTTNRTCFPHKPEFRITTKYFNSGGQTLRHWLVVSS